MNSKDSLSSEKWTKPSTFAQPFTDFTSQQQQKWEDTSKFNQPSENSSLLTGNLNNQSKIVYQEEGQAQINQMFDNGRIQDWDPSTMLNNLSFLEQKIQQLQELVHMIVRRSGQIPGNQDELVNQQHQLITADLTSIIIQLISTAGTLLPLVNPSLSSINPSASQLNGVVFPSANNEGQVEKSVGDVKSFEPLEGMEEDHELKDDDDGKEEEHLPPGSYEILQLEKEEILAPHTHFCTICGKGFKRDANLRMHMRGHGDEYKTPAALAKPNKESSSEQVLLKRYSCPSVGCRRNKDHKKFQPLKTILCVKNHYKRTHCDKSYICSRCHTKKFSVMADLKTHEKHCGRDKWLCSCGTTFSRKDKLFGHIALFHGHTPAIPLEDNKGTSNHVENTETNKEANLGFSFGSDDGNINGIKNMVDVKEDVDPFFSLLNYECSLGGFQDFPQANFGDSSSSFSFFIPGEQNGMQSATNDID